jgi:hypothetical protein
MKQNILSKTAIVILSCKDYESLEVSLPNYLENTPKEVHFFILQNGLGTYDKDRTVRVARRISDLYPERVTVVDWIPEAKPYRAIKQLLHDEKLSKFDYICKVDDDTFPVTTDWIEKLAASYVKNKEKYGDKMAFTFPLVNNNPWGFKRTVELMGLKNEYDENIGRIHYGGTDWASESVQKYYPLKIYQKDELFPSGFGTVWRYPYMARWIHEKTTLDVDTWIKKIENAPDVVFDNTIRYSINCLFFEKAFWDTLDNGTDDDETAVHEKSLENDWVLIACQSIPFVHLFFFSQRDENKDLLGKIRPYYQERLKLNYPMQLVPSKEYELENRLRHLEEELNKKVEVFAIVKRKSLKKRKLIYKILNFLTIGKTKKYYKKKLKEIKKQLKGNI